MTTTVREPALRSRPVRDVPGVLVTAARLFARHWPALLALACAGAALRAGVLWAAVEVSDLNGTVGQLMLVLAPLGYLLPMIAMLHLCGTSLPRLRRAEQATAPLSPTEGRPRRLVDIAVSVLVPFLAVYVSYGLLAEDLDRFRNVAAFDEFNRIDFARTITYDFTGRLGIYPLQIAVMVVAIAWVLRWLLGRVERTTQFLALAFVGALAEVWYTSQLAAQSQRIKPQVQTWLGDRVAVDWVQDHYASFRESLGGLGDVVGAVLGGVEQVLGSFDAVVVVPLAWLTVGAVVLGHKLETEAPAPPEEPARAEPGRRKAPGGRVRRAADSFRTDLAGRWSAFWAGLRLLTAAGLYPMLVFSLAFLLVIRVPSLVSAAFRALEGPQLTATWLAVAPIEAAVGMALSMAVTAPLLAAAVDWLVGRRDQTDGAQSGTASST